MKDFLFYFARRYIAGEKRADAIEAARALNADGISASIDVLGENVEDASDARRSVAEYLALLGEIDRTGVDASVSLKLTHLGLDLSDELAMENAEAVVRRAGELGNFVRVDMERAVYTERTIDLVVRLRRKYDNVGVAVQSYLYRSGGDVARLIKEGVSVRLVKGAYKEGPDVAFRDKGAVDRNFDCLMKELLTKGNRPAIATHDEALIDEAKRFAEIKGIPRDAFDFEMLLGIKRTLQRGLAAEGYNMRVYVPYGPEWLPYITRRLT
ncbi:MAG: proline dehydrogenase family protein, partial [Thermodesulfobacteriota bacterium]